MLTSLLAGGLTGVLGAVFSNLADIWKRRQDRKHEIELRRLDLAIMDKEWEYRTRTAEAEEEVRLQESSDALRTASYTADTARYIDPAKIKSVCLKAALVAVDVIRGLIRPALTVYLLWLVWDTRCEVRTVIEAAGGIQAMDVRTAISVYRLIIEMILYLASTCVTWWFGTRPLKQEAR